MLQVCIYPLIISSVAASFITDKYCASGSKHVAVNGIYEYYEGNFDDRSVTNEPIFINITPCEQDCGFVVKLYAKKSSDAYTYWIGSASAYNSAKNTISYPDPFEFESPQFFTNWVYYNDGWKADTDLRIVNCNEICVTGLSVDDLNGIYTFQSFDRSLSGSVYVCEDCVSGAGSSLRPHLTTDSVYQWTLDASSYTVYCDIGIEADSSFAPQVTDCKIWSSVHISAAGNTAIQEPQARIQRCDATPAPTDESTQIPMTDAPISSTLSVTQSQGISTSSSTLIGTDEPPKSTAEPLVSSSTSAAAHTQGIWTSSSSFIASTEPPQAATRRSVSASSTHPNIARSETQIMTSIMPKETALFEGIYQTNEGKKLDTLHVALIMALAAVCLAFIVFIHYHLAFRKHVKRVRGQEDTIQNNESISKQYNMKRDSSTVIIHCNAPITTAGPANAIHNTKLVLEGSAMVTRKKKAANVVPHVQGEQNGEQSVAFSRYLSNELWGSPAQEISVPAFTPAPPIQETNQFQ